MPKPHRPVSGLALSYLRDAADLEQTDLAEALGVTPGTVSDYERGRISKTREEVEQIVAKKGISPQAVDLMFAAVEAVRRDVGPGASVFPIPLSRAAQAAIARTAAEVTRDVLETLRNRALAAQVLADRRRAQAVWKRIERDHPAVLSDPQKGSAGEETRRSIESERGFSTWALADLLADRSLGTAPSRPRVALVLGELALRAAENAPAAPVFRDQVKAKAWVSICNARRVLGFLPDAERALLEARKLWPVGALAVGNILSEARLFDLEASLRRDLRQFDAAHAALDRAFALSPEGPARGRLFLNQSAAFEQQGNFEGSVEALRQAIPELGSECTGRSRFAVLFNIALNFDQLGRSAETLVLIPEIRELATELRSRPDLLRVLWLETRARIALGERHGADRSLDQIRRDFKDQGLLLDAALAGLDLAILYLERERPAETRELAIELTAVFLGMGIRREQLAAVWLFLDSAEKEAATTELARRAAAALRTSFPGRSEFKS